MACFFVPQNIPLPWAGCSVSLQNSYVETLLPNVMVLGDGGLRRRLGLEGVALWMISIKRPQRTLPLSPCEDTVERLPLGSRLLPDTELTGTFDFDFLGIPGTWERKLCCLQATESTAFCHNSPERLRQPWISGVGFLMLTQASFQHNEIGLWKTINKIFWMREFNSPEMKIIGWFYTDDEIIITPRKTTPETSQFIYNIKLTTLEPIIVSPHMLKTGYSNWEIQMDRFPTFYFMPSSQVRIKPSKQTTNNKKENTNSGWRDCPMLALTCSLIFWSL